MFIKAVKQLLKIKLSFHLFSLILMLTPHQHNHLVTNMPQCFSARGREEFFREADNLPENNRLPTSVLINISHRELKTQFSLLISSDPREGEANRNTAVSLMGFPCRIFCSCLSLFPFSLDKFLFLLKMGWMVIPMCFKANHTFSL